MNEEEQEQETDEDMEQVINSFAPVIQKIDGEDKVLFNPEGLRKKLNEIKKKNELVMISNELLGAQIVMQSKQKSAEELLKIALIGIEDLMRRTPTRIPLGVG